MSVRHPIVAVTGSSGAGTTTVMKSFTHIFRREKIRAQIVEGDAFHRYDRHGMREAMQQRERDGVLNFSHFGPEANLLEELASLFASYAKGGTGRFRHYVHDAAEATQFGQDAGTFTPWEDVAADSDLLFYEGLHGAAVVGGTDIAQH
ncbi:MAG TPA: phosphoribulokinase, partial [Paraburkholderia sp.]